MSAGTRAAKPCQSRFMQARAVRGKAAEHHARHIGPRSQCFGDGGNRDAGRTIGREAIDAGGNSRKGYRRQRVGLAQFERAAIAGSEQSILAGVAAVPDRPDGMNHMPGRQTVAFGDFGIAGGTATQRAAFGKQFGTGTAMDRAIDAAPAEQRRIRGVDDGVNAQTGDIGNNNFQPRLADQARGVAQAEAAALTVTPLSANSCCNSPAWNISRMMSQPPTNSPLT